jgi:hypothetical protein
MGGRGSLQLEAATAPIQIQKFDFDQSSCKIATGRHPMIPIPLARAGFG